MQLSNSPSSKTYYDEFDEDELIQDKWEEYRRRFRLTAIFMKCAHNVRFRFDRSVSENDPLSNEAPFLVTQITSFCIYDDEGNRLPDNTSNLAAVANVEIYYGNITVNFMPSSGENTGPCFSASCFEYDYNSKDLIIASMALKEKAKAALILAYKAKAAGWTEVNFGRTSDQVERWMLYLACRHVDLGVMDGEMINKSVIDDDLDIQDLPGRGHPLVEDYLTKNSNGNEPSNSIFETIICAEFENYKNAPHIFSTSESNDQGASVAAMSKNF